VYFAAAKKFLTIASPVLLSSPVVAEEYFGSAGKKPILSTMANGVESQVTKTEHSEHRQKFLQRFQGRIVSVIIIRKFFQVSIS